MRTGVKEMIGIAALLLAGCGSADKGDGDAPAPRATSNWDASDACALLDKAAIGAALGDAVSETGLGLVNKAEGANAATSECTYILASGGRASLMARQSPIGDNSDAAIKQTRDTLEQTMAAFTDKKIEDIEGLGKAAFFVPGINQLNVFLDDSRFVVLTVGSAPGDKAKDIAVGLVGQIKT